MGRTSLPELAVSNSSSGLGSAAERSTVANLIVSIRPGEWTKNLFVFAGLLCWTYGSAFACLDANPWRTALRHLAPLVAAALLVAAVYVILSWVEGAALRERERREQPGSLIG